MNASPPMEGRTVLVRLSDIPKHLRQEVAGYIVERGKLRGDAAAAFLIAQLAIRHDPVLEVPADKADRVLREGKLPTGPFPKVWTW